MSLYHALWGVEGDDGVWQVQGTGVLDYRIQVAKLMVQGYGRDLYAGSDKRWNLHAKHMIDQWLWEMPDPTAPGIEDAPVPACAALLGRGIMCAMDAKGGRDQLLYYTLVLLGCRCALQRTLLGLFMTLTLWS